MAFDDPDPLNSEGDDLYSIYRKGLITRHISENGRFLEALALESIDEFRPGDRQSPNPYIEVTHSNPAGRDGPNVTIRIPKSNTRYSLEIDPTEKNDGRYAVRPQLWVPLIAPLKYPGISEELQGNLYRGASPWLPQTILHRQYSMKEVFYAASGSGDNPGYYGGMALAALSLEHIYEVSPHSIEYARKLVEGFLAMEMNGRNGYMIRYDRWFVKPGEVKEIRGASGEELMGIIMGIMFYLNAEDQDNPLFTEASRLRDRILDAVSRGSLYWSKYEHPFMTESYRLKHYEFPLYASKGELRGNHPLYSTTLGLGSGVSRKVEGNFFDYAMFLTSMILILEGSLPDYVKEFWAEFFMEEVIKAATTGGRHVDALRKNAYMAVVGLLVNKYLNPQRDSHLLSEKLTKIWLGHEETWDNLVSTAANRIGNPKSTNNEIVDFGETEEVEDHWQHNLPFLSICIEQNSHCTEETYEEQEEVWQNLNPHHRIGAHFEWHSKFPHDFRRSNWKFGDYAIGMDVPSHQINESEYNDADIKRYDSWGYLRREVRDFRNHHNCQIEGAGVSLVFLRMLMTHVNPARYPPPQLKEDKLFPVLPFRGVEPLSPRFLHYESSYRSRSDGWEIGGDKDKALRVIAFPNLDLVVTASAADDERMYLNIWRVTNGGIDRLYYRRYGRFVQVVLDKTSSTGNPNENDIIVVAERAEIQSSGRDPHYLKISMHRILSSPLQLQLLAETRVSGESPDSAKEIDMCILGHRFVGVTFKTRHNKARVKVLELNFTNNQIIERIAVDAESGTGVGHEDIADAVWIGSAWDDVLINGYKSKANPNSHFELFSRRWNGMGFGSTDHAIASAGEGKPVGAIIVERGEKYYVVSVSYSGSFDSTLTLESWEISQDGGLLYRGSFEVLNTDAEFLYRGSAVFDRLSISRARFGYEGGFVIAGKGFTDARRPLDSSNKGLLILYGRVMDDGKPTLVDWNCAGEGDGLVNKGVKMVDVTGEAQSAGQLGAVTAHKSKHNGLVLTWWRYSEDFKLRPEFRVDPVGLSGIMED